MPSAASRRDSHSTEEGTGRQSRSDRSHGSAHDQESVASSQSSAFVVETRPYKEMSKRDRKSRTPDPSTRSCGYVKQSLIVMTLMIGWVIFYAGKTFPDQITDFISSVALMSSTEDKVLDSSNTEQTESGGKSGDPEAGSIDEQDPDATLASLASGTGANLWENVMQMTDVTPESANSEEFVAGDPSMSSLSAGMSTEDRPTKDSDENAKNVATHDVSMSDTTSFNSDATEDGSTSLNDLAVSKDQSSGDVNADSLHADTIYPDLTVGVKSLADARSIDNEKQPDLPESSGAQSSDANRSVQRPTNARIDGISTGNLLDSESAQELPSQGLEEPLQETLDSTIDESRKVGGTQDTSNNESMQEGASNQQQAGNERARNVDDQILLDQSNRSESYVERQGNLRGSNSLHADMQPLSEGDLSTSLRGPVAMRTAGETDQMAETLLHSSQSSAHFASSDASPQGGDGVIEQDAFITDVSASQESLSHYHDGGVLSPGATLRNPDGNGMILQNSGLQRGDGSLELQELNDMPSQDGGVSPSDAAVRNAGGKAMTLQDSGMQRGGVSMEHQQQQSRGMIPNDISTQGGGDLPSDMTIQNVAGVGMIPQDIGLQMGGEPFEHQEQQGGGVLLDDMSSQNAVGDVGDAIIVNQLQPRQQQQRLSMKLTDVQAQDAGNGMTLQEIDAHPKKSSISQQQTQDGGVVSIGTLEQSGSGDGIGMVSQPQYQQGVSAILQDNGVQIGGDSMAKQQQFDVGLGSSHLSLQNGDASGVVGENNGVSVAFGEASSDITSQNEGSGLILQGAVAQMGVDSATQQQGSGSLDQMLVPNDHMVMMEENDGVRMGDAPVRQVYDGGLIPVDRAVFKGDRDDLRQNSGAQFSDGTTAHDEQRDGSVIPNDVVHSAGNEQILMRSGDVYAARQQRQESGKVHSPFPERNDEGNELVRQQNVGSMALQQDLGDMSQDLSSGTDGNGVLEDDTNGGLMMQQQMAQQDGDTSPNALAMEKLDGRESIDVSALNNSMGKQHMSNEVLSQIDVNGMRGSGESGGNFAGRQAPLLRQAEGMMSDNQQALAVNERALEKSDSTASDIGTSRSHGSQRQNQQGHTLETITSAGDGSILRGNADGAVINNMVDDMSNVSQAQGIGSRNLLSQQSSRLPQGQGTQSQTQRRLQDVPVPQSPYESMDSAELAQYVTNHAQYRNLVNFDEDLPFDTSSQVPYLFHIHKSGGSSMKHMLLCMGLTQTRRGSSEGCDDKDDSLHACPLVWGTVVNADASSPEGIARIKKLRIFDLNLPNLVITTSRVYEALSIFTPQHRGRLFLIFRDPVERAISKYYYGQVATWERNYNPAVANMTLIEFAQSRFCHDNWITRRLIHKMNPLLTITPGDLRLAKEILRQKALILLLSDLEQSSYRMVQYFGWGMTSNQHGCGHRYSNVEVINNNPHPMPSKDSPEWAAIREKNLMDIELYRYASELYHDHQGPFLSAKFGSLSFPEPVDSLGKQQATQDAENVR